MQEAVVDAVAEFTGEVEEPKGLGFRAGGGVDVGALGGNGISLEDPGKWTQDFPVGFFDDDRAHIE